jgi:peptidoglycan/LPS O-acetylase OafA/YrhL
VTASRGGGADAEARSEAYVRRVTSAPPLPSGRQAFRPEVQALRAVAVAGVVLFHLWPHAVPGGYAGVDVFFVISGFLITQQLADEALRTGQVRLLAFWGRRIRRILPAALTVLLACVALVELVLPRVVWGDDLPDIRAAAAYFVNWQLGLRSVDYLAADSAPSLVQHYWSLSVEEQFYLVWPLLVLVAVVVARRVAGARLRAWIVLVLVAATVASFVTSVVWTAADPALAFFATPTRAWEFGAGGLVAVLLPRIRRLLDGPGRAALTSWLGIAAVLASYAVLGAHSQFPGAVALLPVAGAVLFLAAELADGNRWSPARASGGAVVQWLGDNSYSIYLWHWPLLLAAPWVVHHDTGTLDKLTVLTATLLLAAATKVLVEDPVRTGALWRSRQWLTYLAGTAGVGALVVVASALTVSARHEVVREQAQQQAVARAQISRIEHHPHVRSCFGAAAMLPVNACPHPFARPPHLDTAAAAADGRTDPCLQDYDAATPALCVLGRKHHPTRTVALVGNSHAWRLVPALEPYAKRHGWKLVVASRINCLGLVTTPVGSGGASPNCLAWDAAVQRDFLAMHLDAVVFASYRYSAEFTDGAGATPAQDAATAREVEAFWRALRARGTQPIVVQDVPGMRPRLDPQCIAQSRAHDDPCAVPAGEVVRPNLLTRLAHADPTLADYVPIDQYFCDARRCHALIGGVVVYFDDHHITTTFARSLGPYLGAAVARDLPPPPR